MMTISISNRTFVVIDCLHRIHVTDTLNNIDHNLCVSYDITKRNLVFHRKLNVYLERNFVDKNI